MKNELNLLIDDLILEGFSSIEQEDLQLAISQSLNQLIAENGLPEHLASSVALEYHKPIEAKVNLSLSDLAQYIAQQIYSGQQDK